MEPNRNNLGIEQALQQIAQSLQYWVSPDLYLDGWIPLTNETHTYLATNQVTVPSGATNRYSVGDKYSIVQSGTTKYFYIVAITATVLTLYAGTDFTVANATISSPKYSKSSTPMGFPHYFSYTPTTTNINLGTGGSVNGRMTMNGRQVIFNAQFILGTGGSVTSTFPTLSIPLVAGQKGNTTILQNDNGVANYYGLGFISVGNTAAVVTSLVTSAAYASEIGSSGIIPFTYGVNDNATIHGQYGI